MKAQQKDKTLSMVVLLISGMVLMYGVGISNLELPQSDLDMGELFSQLIKTYFDIIIIGYIFICLQIAGYVELKYKQDYLTISLLSIILTPFSLLFIKLNDR